MLHPYLECRADEWGNANRSWGAGGPPGMGAWVSEDCECDCLPFQILDQEHVSGYLAASEKKALSVARPTEVEDLSCFERGQLLRTATIEWLFP